MRALLLIAQMAATTHVSLAARDSIALLDRVKDAELQFVMDWRYQWQRDMYSLLRYREKHPRVSPPHYDPGIDLRMPSGTGCIFEGAPRFDQGTRDWMAHFIKAPARLKLSLCPTWSFPNWYEPPDERRSIDASLTSEGLPPDVADAALVLRRAILALLDSAGRALPGDGWIAGQRVRLHLDQTEVGAARRVATDCRAAPWWCTALLGYVEFTAGEVTRASATFDRARKIMPDEVLCAWDDVGQFFNYTGRKAYEAMSCHERIPLDERIWWLADPLYLEAGNERRTEHYARHVLIELHGALEADERFDWRDDYQGPALREMVMRYGWPTQILTWETASIRWHRGNTKSLFLGDNTITVPTSAWCDGTMPWRFITIAGSIGNAASDGGGVLCSPPIKARDPVPASKRVMGGPWDGEKGGIRCLDANDIDGVPGLRHFLCNPYIVLPGITYWGPQFHTVPLWRTVLDPYQATDEGWDLAPPRDAGPYFDTSWWPQEFYRRDSGPLVPLSSQAAFFRRQKTAVLATAMSWDTIAYMSKPLDRMVGAAIITTGPNTPLQGIRDTMSGRTPRPLVSTVPSGPALLGVEMVPVGSSGPAARTRFGVNAPPPLSALLPGDLALSDIVLTSATAAQGAPATFAEMLPRMLGTTLLRDPRRMSLFWELYGLNAGDTVAMAMRMVRNDEDALLRRFAGLFGFGSTGEDSVVVRWTEPRPGDPTATIEGGVTIRPRGLVVDMSALAPGRYSVEIVAQRIGGLAVTARRLFRIQRN